jgi:hypothetical protein
MADAQLFRLPNGDNIVVENDGKVIFDYTPFDGGYRAEEDISATSLGTLLRAVLLQHGSLETPLKGRGAESPLRDSALSIECFSASGSSASGGVLVPNGKRSPSLLKQEIKNQLLAANIPAKEIEFFGTVHVYVEYLNKSRNPVKTAETFRAKDSYPRRFKSWSDRRKAKQNGGGSATAPEGLSRYLEGDEVELPKSKAFQIDED